MPQRAATSSTSISSNFLCAGSLNWQDEEPCATCSFSLASWGTARNLNKLFHATYGTWITLSAFAGKAVHLFSPQWPRTCHIDASTAISRGNATPPMGGAPPSPHFWEYTLLTLFRNWMGCLVRPPSLRAGPMLYSPGHLPHQPVSLPALASLPWIFRVYSLLLSVCFSLLSRSRKTNLKLEDSIMIYEHRVSM